MADKTIWRPSTPDALVSVLRAEILNGTLAVGTRLTEAEIAATRGVSRHTIKLALTEMAARGLVVQRPNKGVWVREISESDITDLYWVRWVIESEAVSQSAMDSESWSELERCVEAMDRLAPDAAWSEVAEADWRFHSATVASTGSARLTRVHEGLAEETLLSFVQCRPEDDVAHVAQEHRDLLDAIRSGDPATATLALRDHLERSRRSLLLARRSGVVPD